MQSEYIEILESVNIDPSCAFGIEGEWFTDAGITAEGRCWVAPSDAFFERWLFDHELSDRLESLGFEWAFDGALVGAWPEFIFYLPIKKLAKGLST